MSVIVSREDRCGVEVYDKAGDGQPCDRDATCWGWYDGGQHEPMLSRVCYSHETEGAEWIADVLAQRDALAARLAAVEALADECANSGCIHLNDMCRRIRAAATGTTTNQEEADQ